MTVVYAHAGQWGPEIPVPTGGGVLRALPLRLVAVRNADDGELADLYVDRDRSAPLANPATIDIDGNLSFFAEPGERTLHLMTGVVEGAGVLITVPVDPEDAVGAGAPAQVTGLAAGAPGETYVPLTWDAVTGASLYIVEYKESTSSVWVSGPVALTNSAVVGGLTPDVMYNFRVSASNAAGVGTPSTTVAASTSSTFVATPYNKAMVGTLAYESPREPDGSTLFTYSGTRYMACIANDTVIVWEESAVFPGTFGRRNVVGTLPTASAEGEGMAFGIVAGAPFLLVGDQNNGEVWGYAPDTADLMSTWSRSSAAIKDGLSVSGIGGPHTFVAYLWDADADHEFVFCTEADGQVWLVDYDGSGDVLDPANWVTTQIASIARARTIAQNCPADIMGNGRGDLVICARSPGATAAYILAAPVAGAIHTTWAKTALTGFTYTYGASWGCLFDAEGTGVQLDVATFDGTTGQPHYWLKSENYSTIHYLPNPTIDTGDSAWVLGAVPDPAGGPDILVYTYGDQASGTLTKLSLFYWNDTAWENRDAATFEYGHALESRLIAASVTGIPNRGEMLMSDSGGANGGQRMAMFSFYDDQNVLTKTAPSVVHKGSLTSATTSVTVPLDGTPTDGNLLIGIVTAATSTDVITPPAGWEPATPPYVADTGFQVFMKVADGDTDTSDWTRSPNTGTFMVTVIEVAGADTTRPIMNHRARKRPSGSNVTIKNPSLVLDENGVLVIGCWAFSNAQTSAPAYPAGFTQASFTGGQRRHATAWKQFTAAGDTGVLDATAVSATTGTALSLAIRGAA